jgi:hypothetical protein
MTTADDILRRAQEQTGLRELDSDSWREGLDVILNLIDDPRMSDGGIAAVQKRCVDALANRLRVHAYVEAHPQVREEKIECPLFIMGMPRTGTTVASYLLGQDPARRPLLKWEALNSAPPATPETLRTDPRCVAMLEQEKQMLAAVAQHGIKLAHWEDADGPTECMFLHEQDFKGLLWDSFTPGTGYVDWMLDDCDVTSAYEYQKLVLQVLQSGTPGRWSLKMPSHSVHLEALLKVFPDARLVWAHRDPYKATGSLCNLLMMPAAMTLKPEAIDKAALGANCKRQMREHVMRPLAVRERIGDKQFFDLHYAAFLRDPIGELRKLYAWDGLPFTDAVETRMRAWLADNPQHKLGKAEYTLDEYGLSTTELKPVFAEYMAAFNVELEGSA